MRLWSPRGETKPRRYRRLLKRIMKKYGAPLQHRHRWASGGISGGDERDVREVFAAARHFEVGGRLNNPGVGGEFASAVFGDGNGRCSRFFEVGEDAAEIQLSSRPGAQPIQSGAPSRARGKVYQKQRRSVALAGGGAPSRHAGSPLARNGGRAACRRASVTLTPPRRDHGRAEVRVLEPRHRADRADRLA